MTQQTPEQLQRGTTVSYDTAPAPAAAAPQPPLESTAPGDGGAAPAAAGSPSLEPTAAAGSATPPTAEPDTAPDDSVAAGDVVTWVHTDADGFEHQRQGVVVDVLELPDTAEDGDGSPVLHARVAELPEPRLVTASHLERL